MTNKQDNNLFGIKETKANLFDLEGKYRSGWVEESVFFEDKFGKQVAMSESKNYLGNHFTQKKFFYLYIFLLFLFTVFFLRILYLQLLNGDEYRLLAEQNRQRIIPVFAERGLIYDRNGEIISKNIPSFNLTIIPQNLPKKIEDREKIIEKLAMLTNQSKEIISEVIEEYKDYSYESVIIKENLDYNQALLIQIEAPNLPGIEIQRSSKRLYINNLDFSNTPSSTKAILSLSHVLGYEGKLNKDELTTLHDKGYLASDNIGKSGIEKTYEPFLRGIYGKKRIEVNASGKEQNILAEEVPIPGDHIKLSIDLKIQAKLEEVIRHYLDTNKKKKASGIVLDPNTGEVLALVSLPAFDNNDFSGGITRDKYNAYLNDENNPLFDRVIAGSFPSGSTIKPAIAAIALQEGIINSRTSFLSTGGLQVGDWFFPDWQAGGHGVVDVRKALAWSVNTFFYYLGGGYGNFTGLGVDKITAGLKKFGFSQKTGIDLPGEQAGFLPSKEWKEKTYNERWYVGDTYNLSIGQGQLLVTPLQIANMTVAVANKGTLYEPHVVLSTVNAITKQENKIIPSTLSSNFIDQDKLEIIKLGMRDCVVYGSCRLLSGLPFESAGKTGTAQWNSNKPNHAWFTSFAPYKNPQIVVTIMVEEGGEGSGISAPIANDFYKWWWQYKKVN